VTVAEVPLTDQQRAALEAHDVSVSLAAGAGCGKTFVLTERFISQLDPAGAAAAADLDQLIAITFTDAAAREMRDRIRKRCYARLQSAETPREAAAWQRLMRSMDAARISTIHAFCTALLRSHAVQAGLDPAFEVLDAPAAELLRLEVVDDRLRTLLVERNDDVLDVAAERGLERLRSDLASFVGPRNAKLLAKWKDATSDQLVAHWIAEFEARAPELAAQELLASGEIRELRRWADPALVITNRVRDHMARLALELTEAHILSQPIGTVLASLASLARVQGVCTVKDWASPDDFARFKDAAAKLRERLKKTSMQLPDDLDAARDAARIGLALVRLAADASQALEAAKASRGQLEFDDLLVRAHRLLTDPANVALQRRVSERTVLLMVDEFQDTNQLQVDIIKAFCGEGWQRRGLFAVGDFKQSIYRFTGAKPRVSTDLRAELPAAGRLSLTTNFRSQPAVLDFVNAVFRRAFPDYEPLVAKREQLTPTPAVEFLWTPGPKTIDGEADAAADQPTAAAKSRRPRKGAKGDARGEEARWIARRIKQLIESGESVVVDMKTKPPMPRALQLGDVAVLLRALSDAQLYEEALRAEGLDYYLAGGHAFYSQQEIYDVLNLLRAVASSIDDIALAGALRSPLFALKDETLYWLVQAHGSLNAAIASDELPPELGKDEAEMVRRAIATVARLRLEKDRLLVADLLSLALELTGYDATLLAEFLGPRKAANIEKLVEQARAVDRSSPGNLPAFITQLSEFVTRAPKEALAATQTEGGNVVRIMTIHHAKGLEFPLVVLPDLERPRHFGAVGPVLDEQLGPLVTLADRPGCLGYDLYRRLEGAEDLEERKRLFYVACTRAADHLILSSSIDCLDEPSSDLLQLVDQTMSLADGQLRVSLPANWRAPQVRVITERPEAVGEPGEQARGADLHRLVVKTRELSEGAPRSLPSEALERAADHAARRRFSFSQLTGALKPLEQTESPAEAPSVDDADDVSAVEDVVALAEEPARESASGREFGTLVHAVLQRVDFQRPAEVARLCEFLAPQLVTHEPAKAASEAAHVIERFLQSPLAAELSAAAEVRREVEFLLQWPPGKGRPDGPYLHGFLDCLFQDSVGRWRLIDYKTNRATAREVPEVAALYELQMLAYRLACEQALGEPLAECVLVLLHPGLTHTYQPDAAADRRGMEQITKAIAAMRSAPTQT
jgi:ATP-dependent helicase/nuclease subunit A